MTRILPLESTTPSTRRTLTRRVLLGGIASAMLVGGGSAAAAAGSTPGPAVPLTQTTTVTASASFEHVPGPTVNVTVTAACPAGYVATGGGYILSNGNSTPGQKAQNIEIYAQYPAAGPDDESGHYYPAPAGSPADAWTVVVSVNTSSTGSITLYAECVG
jgi:hypothetical protein